MIESRVKRALWVISISFPIGFGWHAAYKYHYYQKFEGYFQKQSAAIRALTDECEVKKWMCNLIEGREALLLEVAEYRNDAGDAAWQSFYIAGGTPFVLWVLFFLARWIWTARLRKNHVPESGSGPIFTKKVLLWSFGAVGTALLFAYGIIRIPSMQEIQSVFVSTSVKAFTLGVVSLIVLKIRDAIRRRGIRQNPPAQNESNDTR